MSRRVLFIGDERHPEFHDAVEWLRKHTDVSVNMSPLDTAHEPDVIVIGQSRPGQFAAHDLEQLHRQAPLARLVALLGSWCEGETRTGHPWPGVIRWYWHQWQPRFNRELFGADANAIWRWPRTTTDVEQLLHMPSRPTRSNGGLIAIHTYDAISFDCLADACLSGGFAVARVPPHDLRAVRGAAAAVWEARTSSDTEFETLRQLFGILAPAPIVAILNFPRLDDQLRARAAGAASVIGKPFFVDDLLWQLDSAIGAAKTGAAA